MQNQVTLPVLFQVFEDLPLGVIVLDVNGRVRLYNRYEERLAERRRDDVIGRDFFHEVAPCMNVRELGGEFARKIGRESLHVRTEFSFGFPQLAHPRDVVVQLDSISVDGEPFACLLVEDVSAQRAIDRMKETLSQLLVHDLKNPLAVILGNLELVRMSAGDSAAVTEPIDDAMSATHRLERMVMNLLDITRLETGAFPLRRAHTPLPSLLRALAAEMQGLALMRRVHLVADVSAQAEALVANVDADIVRRAIDNLVENAVRHTKKGGSVIVRAARTGEREVAIEIVDDGPGIPDGERERVFEKYQQEGATGHALQNRGLGLTFVRLAARAHGGEASVTCPPTGGSIFRITLKEPA